MCHALLQDLRHCSLLMSPMALGDACHAHDFRASPASPASPAVRRPGGATPTENITCFKQVITTLAVLQPLQETAVTRSSFAKVDCGVAQAAQQVEASGCW